MPEYSTGNFSNRISLVKEGEGRWYILSGTLRGYLLVSCSGTHMCDSSKGESVHSLPVTKGEPVNKKGSHAFHYVNHIKNP